MKTEKFTKYAVVDLEATGTSATAKIIQVGIVILENGQVVETYETDVNPHEPLSEHIKALTGLTDERLAQAPDFSQVAKAIFERLEGCVFVAHNVKFDANLLAEELFMEGYELRLPLVDTVELSQIFFPTLERYNLSTLASALHLDLSDAHTAISDATATAQLFLKLQEKIASLPKLTLETIRQFSDQLLFESRLVIDQIFEIKSSLVDSSELVEVGGLMLRKPKAIGTQRHLSKAFETNLALLDLDARDLQLAFAKTIAERFSQKAYSFVEAATGIGKTYGYLLPLLANEEVKQLIVTVPTKALQDQLMANEVKQLEEVFHIPSQSLKSPQNYLSLERFWDSLQTVDDNRLANRYKMQLLVWLCETETGDLDEIRQKQRLESFFTQLQHDGELSSKSLFATVDFWQRHYERAKKSRLVVTNHAYLMTRVEDDKAFVAGKTLVIDEAQKFFLTLEDFSRRTVSIKVALEEIHQALGQRQSTLVKRLLESLQFELTDMAEEFTLTQRSQPHLEKLEQLRLCLEELELPILKELRQVLDRKFGNVWMEEEVFSDHRRLVLKSARLDFMALPRLLPEMQQTYLVSATLQISPQVTVADLLGIEDYTFDVLETPLAKRQQLFIDTSMPEIGAVSDKRYIFEIAERLRELVTLKRPILVLCNANKMMFALSEVLEEWGISHLCQHKNGLAINVKRRFDKGESRLLLGTGSFWEGVDFAHQDELICVITRLPFDNPTSAFSQKMEAHLRHQGKDAFQSYSLPVAILKLKQAIGRTKRREEQRSAVLILDKRMLTKSYGEAVMDSLSEQFSVQTQNFPQILAEIGYFFQKI